MRKYNWGFLVDVLCYILLHINIAKYGVSCISCPTQLPHIFSRNHVTVTLLAIYGRKDDEKVDVNWEEN
jgi:hypothetical protein